MWNVWGRREMHAGFWWGNIKKRDRLHDVAFMGGYYYKVS
jgi:hypothetical protein